MCLLGGPFPPPLFPRGDWHLIFLVGREEKKKKKRMIAAAASAAQDGWRTAEPRRSVLPFCLIVPEEDRGCVNTFSYRDKIFPQDIHHVDKNKKKVNTVHSTFCLEKKSGK